MHGQVQKMMWHTASFLSQHSNVATFVIHVIAGATMMETPGSLTRVTDLITVGSASVLESVVQAQPVTDLRPAAAASVVVALIQHLAASSKPHTWTGNICCMGG